ncbi:hypothetical protein FRC07_005372 [Ceratobasidium sp. 392]|nr:hypothetical protein FRC07_005372 [Ceratobasidium sp. 392]
MQIPDFGALSDAFVIANKYNLGAMRGALIDLLSQPNSPVNIRNDPVMAYSIALTYGLSAEAQTASRLAIGKVDFRQEGVWDELKRKGVLLESATKLSQKQFAWEGALADCLLRAPMASGGELLLKKQEWEMLECARCVGWDGPRDGPTGLLKWQQLWAEKVYARLLCTPLNDCAYMFRPRYVIGMWSEGCEGCLVQLVKSQLVLDLWMDRVWKMLEKRWTGIFGDM